MTLKSTLLKNSNHIKQDGLHWPIIAATTCLSVIFFIITGLTVNAKTSPKRLPEIVHQTLQAHFAKSPRNYQQWAKSFAVSSAYQKPAGIFVTLSIHHKTRACWGHLTPTQPDLVKESIFTTLDAIQKEYRYPPIQSHEIKQLKAQVAIVRGVTPIRSYRELNPFRDGLLLRSGSHSAIILPKESTDAYYEWLMARNKAGISKNAPQQLYKLHVTLEEE